MSQEKQAESDIILKIQEYLKNSQVYYANSEKLLNEDESSKSGELMWGAIAEVVKALTLIKTKEPIKSHAMIREFLKQTVLENRHRGLTYDLKRAADNLHSNFYETNLEGQDFNIEYEKAKRLFAFLTKLTLKP